MELYENRQCEKIKGLTNDANDVSISEHIVLIKEVRTTT